MDLTERITSQGWYHTMELPGGIVTDGMFDHRSVLDHYGLPQDLSGRRVLDVGTYDGFFAFTFERCGAEVVAVDVPGEEHLDWPAPLWRREDRRRHTSGRFELAHEALGSSVEKREMTVYDVSEEELGRFDLVFAGSLLIHLRDPVGALMRLFEVCDHELRLVAVVDPVLELLSWWSGMARFQGTTPHMTWWLPNRRALVEMVESAGFHHVRAGRPFSVPRPGDDDLPHVTVRGFARP